MTRYSPHPFSIHHCSFASFWQLHVTACTTHFVTSDSVFQAFIKWLRNFNRIFYFFANCQPKLQFMTHITLSILFCQACQLQLLPTQRNIDRWLWWAFIAGSGHRYLEPIPVRPPHARPPFWLIESSAGGTGGNHSRQIFGPKFCFHWGFFPRFFLPTSTTH